MDFYTKVKSLRGRGFLHEDNEVNKGWDEHQGDAENRSATATAHRDYGPKENEGMGAKVQNFCRGVKVGEMIPPGF